jgi:hypothetical protein
MELNSVLNSKIPRCASNDTAYEYHTDPRRLSLYFRPPLNLFWTSPAYIKCVLTGNLIMHQIVCLSGSPLFRFPSSQFVF